MVTTESNRAQTSATAPYERQTQPFQPAAEAVAEQPQAEQAVSLPLHDPFWFTSLVVAGATIGSMWGLSTVVLAILGLSGVLPMYMLPVAGIVLGSAFLTLGAVGIAWARMFGFAERESRRDRIVFSSGVAAALMAGVAAVILGILNLVFVADARFAAVAVIVMGAALLWHSGVMRRVARFTYHGMEGRRLGGPFSVNALSLAPVRDFLLGLGGTILGILAILGIAPVILSLVALLAIGGAISFTATTICGATLATLKGTCSKVA